MFTILNLLKNVCASTIQNLMLKIRWNWSSRTQVFILKVYVCVGGEGVGGCHSWLRNLGKAAFTLSAIVQQACLFLEVTETGCLIGYYSVVKYKPINE